MKRLFPYDASLRVANKPPAVVEKAKMLLTINGGINRKTKQLASLVFPEAIYIHSVSYSCQDCPDKTIAMRIEVHEDGRTTVYDWDGTQNVVAINSDIQQNTQCVITFVGDLKEAPRRVIFTISYSLA